MGTEWKLDVHEYPTSPGCSPATLDRGAESLEIETPWQDEREPARRHGERLVVTYEYYYGDHGWGSNTTDQLTVPMEDVVRLLEASGYEVRKK